MWMAQSWYGLESSMQMQFKKNKKIKSATVCWVKYSFPPKVNIFKQ